uniref:Single domain-containing protein n=1 Tax=Amblyomma cajennense TaxID=34607 RepID=A0A023FDM9_AMBCJ
MLKFTMKVLLLTTMLMAGSVLGGVDEDLQPLEIFGGECHYRGQKLADGQKLAQKDLCELWKCRTRTKELIITGCPLGPKETSCIPRNQGYYPWPDCCKYQNLC